MSVVIILDTLISNPSKYRMAPFLRSAFILYVNPGSEDEWRIILDKKWMFMWRLISAHLFLSCSVK